MDDAHSNRQQVGPTPATFQKVANRATPIGAREPTRINDWMDPSLSTQRIPDAHLRPTIVCARRKQDCGGNLDGENTWIALRRPRCELAPRCAPISSRQNAKKKTMGNGDGDTTGETLE